MRFAVDEDCSPLMVECLLGAGLLGELDAVSVCLGYTPVLKLVEGSNGKGRAELGVVMEFRRFVGEFVAPIARARRGLNLTPVTYSCPMAW